MCPQCRAFITTSDKICPYCQTAVGARAVDRRTPGEILGGLIPHARFTTVIILVINFALYAAMTIFSQQAGSGGLSIDIVTQKLFGAKWNEALAAGQWWRLITAGFLHGSIIHILMNSWALFDLGAQVEEFYGTSRYLVLYFVSTAAGFYVSYWWSPAVSTGSSAGILGLIGAMVAFGMKDRSALGAQIKSFYIRWAVYGLIMGIVLPFIDNGAHLGGFGGGFVAGYVMGAPRLVPGFRETLWRFAAMVCLGITVLAFFQMFVYLLSQSR